MQTTEAHALWSNAALAIDSAVGVALIAYAARTIPTPDFGAYLFALTLVELISLLDLGVLAILPRALLESGEKAAGSTSALLGAVVKAGVVMGVLLGVIAVVAATVWSALSGKPNPGLVAGALVVTSGSLFVLPTLALTRAYEAERRFPALARTSIALSVTRLAAGVLVLSQGLGVIGLAAVYGATTAARCGALYASRTPGLGGARDWSRARIAALRPLLRFSKWSAYDNALRHAFFKGDVFLIGTIGNVTMAGFVSVGRRIPNLIWQAIVKAAAVSLPTMAQAHVRGDLPRLRAVLMRVTVRLTQIALPVAAIWWLIAPEIIDLWVGSAYSQSTWAMRWALAGVAVLPLSVPATNVCYGANQMRASAVSALVEVILLVALAPIAFWWGGPMWLVPLVAFIHVAVTLFWLVPVACDLVGLSKPAYARELLVPVLAAAGAIGLACAAGGMLFPEDTAARFFSAALLVVWLVIVTTSGQRRSSAVPIKVR